MSFCSGRVPIYVHPSFYRTLKLKYPMDVGDGRVTTELGTTHLRISGPWSTVSKVSGLDGSKPYHVEC